MLSLVVRKTRYSPRYGIIDTPLAMQSSLVLVFSPGEPLFIIFSLYFYNLHSNFFMVECAICGTISESWITRNILTDELSDTWKLDKAQIEKINLRESSYCPICSNSARTRALGKAIV